MILHKRNNIKNQIFLALLFLFLIVFDQTTKIFISKTMIENIFIDLNVLPFLNIVFVRNTGISFGLFSDGGIWSRVFFINF